MTLALVRVGLRAGGRTLLRAWSLEVAAGEVVTLRGPSGAGKSSLLAYISGALPPGVEGEGDILLDGRRLDALPAHRRNVGMLFQDDLLFPHMSVGENLLFGLSADVRGRPARREAVAAALRGADMVGMERHDPASLSGGQRARVSMLRVLLSRPRALLLDEPFGALDPPLRARMRALVAEQVRGRGLPCLWVTHEAEDACGRIVVFPECR